MPEWSDEKDNTIYIGIDEAGRGCLAGPVFAGAVVWRRRPDNIETKLIRDSKTLSKRQRAVAREIVETHADAWAVGTASVADIDAHNILGATMIAMHRAIDKVITQQCYGESHKIMLLVDGNRFEPYISPITTEFVPHTCVTEGDSKWAMIAAASILAKTHKDEYMQGPEAHGRFPQYGWDHNAGYGTADHMRALNEHGPCELHRTSFAPVAKASRF